MVHVENGDEWSTGRGQTGGSILVHVDFHSRMSDGIGLGQCLDALVTAFSVDCLGVYPFTAVLIDAARTCQGQAQASMDDIQ